MVADAPSSYTTYYSFKKWIDGLNPGAVGWNANWDAIDAAIHAAAVSGGTGTGGGHTNEAYLDVINQNLSTGDSPTFADLTLSGSMTASGYLQLYGNLYSRGNLYLINKAANNFIHFAERNTSGAEAVYDLSNIGSATMNGALDVLSDGHFSGDVVVDGNFTVNGDTVVLNAYELDVEDKNIVLGNVASPSNATAAGGGIMLKGLTDKTLIWNNDGKGWTSSEDINLVSTKGYKIDGTYVLSNNTLGVNVVNSSLTKVGTLTTGTWNADAVTVPYGGTGLTSFTLNKLYKGNDESALLESNITDTGSLITLGSDALITGNMTVDGSLTLFELILQRLSYRNGTEVIGDGAKIASVDDGIGRCYCVDFMPFAVNDIVKAQKFSGGTSGTVLYANVLKVLSVNTTYKWFNYEVISGTDPVEGQEYVRIGNYTNADRQGSIVLTASLDNAPYIDIKDGVNDPSLFEPSGLVSDTIKGRFGKLTGIQDADFANIGGADSDGYLPGYGVYLNGSAFIKGNIIADAGYIGGTSGWKITTGTITGGDTRLENSADLSGLAVANGGYDALKIGDFDITDLTYSPTDLTSTYITNASFESGIATGWTITNSVATKSASTTYAQQGTYSLLINPSSATPTGFAFNCSQALSNPTELAGKHCIFKVGVRSENWNVGGNTSNTAPLLSLGVSNQNGTLMSKGFYCINYTGFDTLTIDVFVPVDTTSLTLSLSSNMAAPANYYKTYIDNFKAVIYDKTYTYANKLGFYYYNSPRNYFRIQGGAASLAVSEFMINGDPVCLDRGDYASGTAPVNPKRGQWYTSGGGLFFYNGTGWLELAMA